MRPNTFRDWPPCPPIQRGGGERSRPGVSPFISALTVSIKTRKELQAEKKATPILNVLKHRELTSRIEDLTEQLEDLRSERAIILMYLDCEESRDTAEVKKRCTAAETMLEKLEVSEAKYSYALDDAKNAFADLQEQAKDLDAGELYEARLAIRNEKE